MLIYLKNLIGKKLNWIKHDELIIVPVTHGVVYLNIDDIIYSITDFYEIRHILGGNLDVSVLKIKIDNNELTEATVDLKKACQNFNSIITSITIVNTNTKFVNPDDNLTYQLLDTQGIIFTLEDNYELAFDKDDFGENMSIYRGYNLKKEFEYVVDRHLFNYSENKNVTSKLEYIEIK